MNQKRMRTFSVVVVAALSVQGQRDKRGCFDAAELSCQTVDPGTKSTAATVDVCERLAREVFPNQEVMFNPSHHPEYLNAIEFESEFCREIQQAYSECFWCNEEGEDFVDRCLSNALWTQCGDQMSMEEILVDNEDPIHALYTTEEEILAECDEEFAPSYSNGIWIDWGVGSPSTQDMCMRQNAIKHLCPGYCDGGCFDGPDGTPPSCQPYTGPVDETVDEVEVCKDIDYDHLWWIALDDGPDSMKDISRHADYLKTIKGNTTLCREAQQAYSQCYWCAKDLCFDEESPPTCDKPEGPIDPDIDVDLVCRSIFVSLYNLDQGSRDYFNISLHTEYLLFGKDTPFCDQARQVYHKCVWCHQTEFVEDFCETGNECFSDATLPENFVLPPSYQKFNLSAPGNEDVTCLDFFNSWNASDIQLNLAGCYGNIWLHQVQCPQEFCDVVKAKKVDTNYLGTTNGAQKNALVWMSRVAAFLSFAGASYILYDILSAKKKRGNVYYQMLITVATFDIVTAVAWCFSTAPIDKDLADHVYGAMGSEATCKAQAFFVQLGFTSVFCNVSLAIYYVLTIARGWKEFQLRKIRLYLHGLPVVTGIGLACGAISNYHWIEYGCHILPPPEGDMVPILLFAVIPLGLSIISITMSMWVVYRAVHVQAAKAKKWRLGPGAGGKSTLEKEVFWQCLFYVLAFYITWPIMFSVYLASVDVNGPLGLTLTIAFLAPLQGFWNALVYLRPKIKSWFGESKGSFFKKSTTKRRPGGALFNKKATSLLRSTASNKPSAATTSSNSTGPAVSTASSEPVVSDYECDPDIDPSALLPQRNEVVELEKPREEVEVIEEHPNIDPPPSHTKSNRV